LYNPRWHLTWFVRGVPGIFTIRTALRAHHFRNDVSADAAALAKREPVAFGVEGNVAGRLRHKALRHGQLTMAAAEAALVPAAAQSRYIRAPTAVRRPATAAAQAGVQHCTAHPICHHGCRMKH
jgi:hypothetical protein